MSGPRHAVRRFSALALAATAVVAGPGEAAATYSLIALDRETGTFGGVVASCVELAVVERVYGATSIDASHRGALVTQSYLNDDAHALGLSALEAGATAGEALATMTAPAFDPGAALRQYTVIDEAGSVAVFTGDEAMSYAGHLRFDDGRFVGSAQGNILTGAPVLSRARDAFVGGAHCGLAERLMRAAEAAAAPGEGDARCVAGGKAALSAVLAIDVPGEAPVRLTVDTLEGDGRDPLVELRELLDARLPDACTPLPTGGAGAGGAATAPDPAASADSRGCALGTGAPGGGALVAVVVALSALWQRRARRR